MTIDEAIQHCEEVMMENLEKTKDRNASDPIAINCGECAEEHQQLAEWLKELKAYRELIDKTEEALGRFDLDNTATYTKFYWDCWKVKETNE
jgi:heterodisulfide reductase subunit B